MQNGVAAVAWGPYGYKMMVAEVGSAAQVLELGLAKSLRSSHRIAANCHASALPNQEVHLLQVGLCPPCTIARHESPSSLLGIMHLEQ